MTPTGVQPRHGRARPAGRRRPGAPGRFAGEAAPRLFPDGGETSLPAPTPADVSEAVEPQTREAGTVGGRGDGMTLEQLICGVWDEVVAAGRAACPLCGGELEGRASAHSRPTEGRCRDCGTTIG
ncbi:MAG TPA: hypothetical protein VMF07_19955 [Solirubrobacteraceae bacterium]|nr:hypothetical protein [Solirubrobacteraceae bacterium]